jgi:beta-N-acetylhexosaminidase
VKPESRVVPFVSRRRLLRAALYGAIAATLAACARALGSPSPGPASTTGSPATLPPATSPSPPPAVTAAPSLAPALTLREKVARMLVVGFRGMTVDEAPWVAEAIRDRQLGGVILFDRDGKMKGPRNVESPGQVRRLVADLRALAPDREVIVAIDQEGGLVTRLAPRYGYPELQSEEAIGEDGDAAVRRWADGLVETLADAGINLNFAPVVDVDVNPDNPAIGALHRSFSADPAVVARDAEIETQAHRASTFERPSSTSPGSGARRPTRTTASPTSPTPGRGRSWTRTAICWPRVSST